MIDVPIILEPPDIIVVEVLEALPGRPITGERLIRQDGTISLGFYGDVHVRGLTLEQAKVKILLHMRRWVPDNLLGLVINYSPSDELQPVAPGKPADPALPPDLPATQPPEAAVPAEPQQSVPPPTSQARRVSPGAIVRVVSRRVNVDDVAEAFKLRPRDPFSPADGPRVFEVDAQDSVRVFVDIASYNSKVYFVQGDVGTPGRLPITGKETVLDALNYAGGFIPTAEPTDIHLYRPARGDQPARDYLIDHAAILRGDAKANLQIFPDDRLVIGRNAVVKQNLELDRATAAMQSMFNNYNQFHSAISSVDPSRPKDKLISITDWFDLVLKQVAQNPAIMKDRDQFADFVKKLIESQPAP